MIPRHTSFILGFLAGIATLGAGFLLGQTRAAHAQTAPNPVGGQATIQARQIEIVDDLGRVVTVLGANADGGSISLRDSFGRTLMLASATNDGGALAIKNTRNDSPVFLAKATADGGASQWFSADGAPRISIRSNTLGGSISIVNEDNKTIVDLATDEQGAGRISAALKAGREYARIYPDRAGAGVIETYTTGGTRLVTLGSTVGGHGNISTFNRAGQAMTTLTASRKDHGHIYTYDAEGNPLIALATYESGPTLQVFNPKHEPSVTLGPDEKGDGEIVIRNRNGEGRRLQP